MRRTLALLLALLASFLLIACGDDSGGGGGDGNGGGEVRTTPVTFGDGDEVWLQVETGGGFVPYLWSLRDVPTLVLYDDGRLIRASGDGDEVVPTFEVVQLDEEATAELLAEFAAVVDGPDPGLPNVTDLPTTSITVTTDGETRDLGIYALDFEDDQLPADQQAAREAAGDAIDHARSIEGGEPFVPDEWLVLTVAGEADVATAETVPWPLEPERLASTADAHVCTRVSGDERDAVLDALAGQAAAVQVEAGGGTAEIAVVPVLTGDDECPEEFVQR